jgi:hypothetical protein
VDSRKIATGLVVVVMMAFTPSANAQISASSRPTVRGPLSTRDSLQGCRSRTERNNGEVVAKFKVCFGYYLFDPDRENSPATDYGAFWAQATVNPEGAWCARNAQLDLHLPATGVHAKAPTFGTIRATSRARPFTTRLEVDAQGNSDALGVIKKTFTVMPNKYEVIRRRNGRTHRSIWRGNDDRKIAFASGVELSWIPGNPLPAVNPVVGALLRRTNDC